MHVAGLGSVQEVVALLYDRCFRRAEFEVDTTFDGEGRFAGVHRQLKLKAITGTQEATVRQIEDRFRKFARIQRGWLDGAGEPLPEAQLSWARELVLELLVEEDIPKPHLYPTPLGDIEAEWSSGPWEVSATFLLRRHHAELHALNVETRDDDEQEMDLETPQGRAAMATFLRRYLGGHERAKGVEKR
jgi:hypothetical protein